MKHQKFWMVVSGITGFSFLIIANCTNLFTGASVIAGIVQLCINGFVFYTWSRDLNKKTGFSKFAAYCGTIMPIVMASITIVRVLVPALLNWLIN